MCCAFFLPESKFTLYCYFLFCGIESVFLLEEAVVVITCSCHSLDDNKVGASNALPALRW